MGRLCFAVFACLLLVVAGCTPSAEEARSAEQRALAETFEPSFAETSSAYEAAMRDIRQSGQSALSANDQDAVVAVYGELRDAARDAADAFDELTPPAALQARHDAMVANLRQQVEALDQVIDAADGGSDTEITTGLTQLASLLAEFTTVHSAIDQGLAAEL